MRILFAYSLFDIFTKTHPITSPSDIHIGISYLSSYVKQKGHSTQLVVLPCAKQKYCRDLISRTIQKYSPEIMAFTAVSTQYPFMKSMAEFVKSIRPDIYLIAGGSHVSLAPEPAADSSFDCICIGEGELPITELVSQLEKRQRPRNIRNLWIRKADGTFQKNPTRDFVADLDSFPRPDREMWQPWIRETVSSQQVVLLSRGCPFECTYCCNHVFKRLAGGKYVRFRTPENIAAEIKYLKECYSHCKIVYLQTETALLEKNWLISVCETLTELNHSYDPPIQYVCNYRVCRQGLEEDVFRALKRANVVALQIGLESGSESVRKRVLNRHYTNAEFTKTVELGRKHGMDINVYNMLGFPTETLAEHMETVELNRKINPNRSSTSIFFPYPGTELCDLCKAEGVPTEALLDWPMERRKATLDIPTFSKKAIQKAYFLFDWRIYKGNRPFLFRCCRLIRNYVSANQFIGNLFQLALPVWLWCRNKAGRPYRY